MKRIRAGVLAAVAGALALLPAAAAVAQPTSIVVDGKIIKSYITTMSAPEYQGRKTLTPGYEKISTWAAAKFKEWGLQPAGDNGTFFQAVPIRSTFFWTTGIPELTINARKFYIADGDFTVDTWSTPGKPVLGEIVFVGYGISAPAKGLDEYAGVDVRGKIVLAFTGSPQSAPATRGMGMGGPPPAAQAPAATADPWADESATPAKIKTAYDKGAAGILLYNPDPAPAVSAFGGPGGGGIGAGRLHDVEPSPYKRPFVVVPSIAERIFRFVMSRDPQESVTSFTTRVNEIRRDIKSKKVRSAATPMRAQVKAYDTVAVYGEKFKNNTGRNVVAKIEGSDPALKAQAVVLGGHLDHLGINASGIIMNGADDDASGSAVVMEMARLMAVNKIKPKRTVVFALWCGEELGLVGSNFFGEKPVAGVSMDLVVANFNMDMVGLGTRIGAPGAMNFPAIYDVIKRDQRPDVMSLVDASQAGPGGSDYSAFITRGIEALALMTSGGVGHPDYHQAADDAEKIDPDILGKTGQFVLQGVLNVASETGVNLVIPDRLHIYNAQRMNISDFSTFTKGRFAVVAASTTDELLKLVNDRARDLRVAARGQATGAATPAVIVGGRGGGGGRMNLGVKDVAVFGGNVPLVDTAATVLDIGRVDVAREDGEWFSGGLTEKGRTALRAMETAGVVLNLVNPTPKVLGDVLDAAQKPFIVGGTVSLTPDIITRMNAKNALVVVQCDPADAPGCVTRLEDTKKKFGDVDNILLSMSAGPTLDAAKQSLYLTLIKSGWTKDQIYAIAGNSAGTLGGQGNLTRLSPTPAAGRGF